MTANILKQDPNRKRFKRTLIYYDTDTQYAKKYKNRNLELQILATLSVYWNFNNNKKHPKSSFLNDLMYGALLHCLWPNKWGHTIQQVTLDTDLYIQAC